MNPKIFVLIHLKIFIIFVMNICLVSCMLGILCKGILIAKDKYSVGNLEVNSDAF